MTTPPMPSILSDPTTVERGEATLDRAKRALTMILFARPADYPADAAPPMGTGFLVRLGGREFIFTAQHNVWNEDSMRPELIAITGPRASPIVVPVTPGPSTIGRVFHRSGVGPDVAVIEPSERAIFDHQRRPFDAADIQCLNEDAPAERVAFIGFPWQLAAQGKPQLDTGIAGMVLQSVPRSTLTSEAPDASRKPGLAVFHSDAAVAADGTPCATYAARGMSGGPLVTLRGCVVGIARGRMRHEIGRNGGYFQFFEHAHEAARLLVGHEDPAVAKDAREIVERCDRLAEGSK